MPREGRLAPNNLTVAGYPCETTPVMDGPNLRPRANWIRCAMFQFIPQMNKMILRKTSNLDIEPFHLMLSKVEYFTHGVQMAVQNAQVHLGSNTPRQLFMPKYFSVI